MVVDLKVDWRWAIATSGWIMFGAALALGVLCIIGPIHLGKDAPAWVQAIGSVMAILVAVIVPFILSYQERGRRDRDQALRAKSLAFVLLPAVVAMQRAVRQAEHRWARIIDEEDDDSVLEVLAAPDALIDRLVILHELGPALSDVHDVLDAIDQLRRTIPYAYNYLVNGGVSVINHYTGETEDMEEPDSVEDAFNRASTTSSAAVETLRSAIRSSI